MYKPVIVIPARYNSSRFPGKPLAKIHEKYMIQHVWGKAIQTGYPTYIATDDDRIEKVCKQLQMNVLTTSTNCLTGTDRVFEAIKQITPLPNVIINVQGDEPLINPEDIITIANKQKFWPEVIHCGMTKIVDNNQLIDPNVIKIVIGALGDAQLIYASRSSIPYFRTKTDCTLFKQVCIYGFSYEFLSIFGQYGSKSGKTPLEKVEDIEILRFLELGCKVNMVELHNNSFAVDIPSDISKIETIIKSKN